MAYFEVWDLDGGKMIQSFEREDEALALVRSFLETGFAGYFEDLCLGYTDDEGNQSNVADGPELAERALRASPVA